MCGQASYANMYIAITIGKICSLGTQSNIEVIIETRKIHQKMNASWEQGIFLWGLLASDLSHILDSYDMKRTREVDTKLKDSTLDLAYVMCGH